MDTAPSKALPGGAAGRQTPQPATIRESTRILWKVDFSYSLAILPAVQGWQAPTALAPKGGPKSWRNMTNVSMAGKPTRAPALPLRREPARACEP
jgi:hypothetical protein